MAKALNIYVASSWRNIYQPETVRFLRTLGHEVYDFRNPKKGDEGFRWSEIDPDWKSWTVEQYAKALEHPAAERGFKNDIDALEGADLCVLVLPSGRSASFEYGYHLGKYHRSGIVYMPEMVEPDLMYKGSFFVDSLESLKSALESWKEKRGWGMSYNDKIVTCFRAVCSRTGNGASPAEVTEEMYNRGWLSEMDTVIDIVKIMEGLRAGGAL